MSPTTLYPQPQGNLALPLTFLPSSSASSSPGPSRALIIGSDKLAAHRAFTFLDSGFAVSVLRVQPAGEVCEELVYRDKVGQVDFIDRVEESSSASANWAAEQDISTWTTLLQSVLNLSLVTVTDTVLTPSLSSQPRSFSSAQAIHRACRSLHLPHNITDHPSLSTYTFPSIARFPSSASPNPSTQSSNSSSSSSSNKYSDLQISISTNGKGCRLAGRLRREILKIGLRGRWGAAVENMGELRERVRKMSVTAVGGGGVGGESEAEEGAIVIKTSRCTSKSRSRSRSRNAPTPTDTDPSSTQNIKPRPPPLPLRTKSSYLLNLEDDDTSLLSGTGPLNSPVPQISSPMASGANTPRIGRGGLSRSGSYFGMASSASGSGSGLTLDQLSVTTASTPDLSRTDSDLTPTATTVVALEEKTVLSPEEEQLRRMRWISQISEYWPIEYLARMSEDEMGRCLDLYESGEGSGGKGEGGAVAGIGPGVGLGLGAGAGLGGRNGVNEYGQSDSTPGLPTTARHELALNLPTQPPQKKGRILLLGSGPGHPSLLTVAAHEALKTSTLILSDKLVPSEILALIPKSTPLHIAKKFPGNAEGAQNEMMELALEGALKGEVVVRLKQGDPFVYGRGGEEVLFFRENGFEPVVVPGVSSALAGPLMMGIPVTQRGVAESMVLCTGVGRKGKAVQLPGYVRSRSLVVLMGVARIRQVLDVLMRPDGESVTDKDSQGWRDGAAFPPHLPIAIIERASSHDQRMVASTLEGIEHALEVSGEQRPPGMMIIGWAVLALEGEGEVTVLDDDESSPDLAERDKARVEKWLGGKEYILKDGLNEDWNSLLPETARASVEELA